MIKLQTFDERFRYLMLNGSVGIETFGFDRYLNQMFYKSPEWKSIRDYVIIRDNGCDLGCDDYPIWDTKWKYDGKQKIRKEPIYIHHMNPIRESDIVNRNELILDPEFLISTSFKTHNALHYGDETFLQEINIIERTINDTCPWK